MRRLWRAASPNEQGSACAPWRMRLLLAGRIRQLDVVDAWLTAGLCCEQQDRKPSGGVIAPGRQLRLGMFQFNPGDVRNLVQFWSDDIEGRQANEKRRSWTRPVTGLVVPKWVNRVYTMRRETKTFHECAMPRIPRSTAWRQNTMQAVGFGCAWLPLGAHAARSIILVVYDTVPFSLFCARKLVQPSHCLPVRHTGLARRHVN